MSNNIGVKQREHNRNRHKKRIKSLAEQILNRFFPLASMLPEKDIFHINWNELIKELSHSFRSSRDIKLGFNHCVSLITKRIDEQQSDIEPPTYWISQKADTSIRSQSWVSQATAFQKLYHSWMEELSTLKSSKNMNRNCRSIVLSLICHSGCCDPKLITAFCKKLNDQLNIKHINNMPFVELTINAPGYNSNVTQDKEVLTIYNCFLSPLTLGFINKWLALKSQPENSASIAPETSKGITALIKGCDTKVQLNLASNLKGLCASALRIIERLPDVTVNQAMLEYATGTNKSYSLPSQNLSRLKTTPIKHNYSPITFHTPFAHVKFDKEKTRSLLPSKSFFNDLTTALRENGVKKLSARQLTKSLEDLQSQLTLSTAQEILLRWLIMKSKTCKPSSIRTYHSTLSRKWLYFSEKYQLEDIDNEDLLDLYQTLINNTVRRKQKDLLSDRLNDFHSFAVREFNLPLLNEPIHMGKQEKSHTSAGFVDETLFRGLLNTINNIIDLDNQEKLIIQAVLIISYRCGLRIGEVTKLRLRDIETSATGWLEIRENQYGNNKSNAALRKVPLFPLLLELEKNIVRQVLHNTRAANINRTDSALAFGIGVNKDELIDKTHLSRFTSTTLRELSGLEHFVFHHLRHSAISRLQLMIELDNPQELLPEAVPYSKTEIDRIIHLIIGGTIRNQYYAIAAFNGHGSPEVCFSHYFHFCDIILGHQLSKMKLTATQKQIKLMGLGSRRGIRQLLLSQSDNQTVSIKLFLPYLIQRLKIQDITQTSALPHNHSSGEIKLNNTKQKTVSISTCYAVLQHIHHGIEPTEVCHKFQIEQETVQKWYANAMALRQLMTKYKKPRLRFVEGSFLPAKPTEKNESKWLSKLISKSRVQFSEDRENIIQAIKYCLDNTSSSRSGVYFNSPEDLSQFISAFSFAIPKSKWRIVTLLLEHSPQKKQWSSAFSGIDTVVGKIASPKGRKGRGAVRLELKHSNEKHMIKKHQQKYSSSALLYFIHMVSIMMWNAPIQENSFIKGENK
ncbi:tyrosine-type recombinase/integrase [Parashewanella tropica]|uniref:tyrosine-type recombinase/integrase n=1 Tax=Parashewanella tropica TaxID=2547970 RepID=UPI00105A3E28|nr:tyrosine-type recombinase/integrase [Parashewanella tropica]